MNYSPRPSCPRNVCTQRKALAVLRADVSIAPVEEGALTQSRGTDASGHGRWRQVIKRGFDLLGVSVGLVCLSPVMLLVAVVLIIKMGRPILFRQRRPGRFGKPFCLHKFRTMTEFRGAEGRLLSDAERLTPLGTFLRRTSLDELPQLWNVLRGDMSLVGPRPLLLQYLDRYTPRQARRMEVPPGITGWAQIHGRNAIRWEEKFELDVWYVENWSLGLDLHILWLTAIRTLRREGISAAGHATMPEFMGSTQSRREAA